MGILIVVASLGWIALVLTPWRPWGTEEQLEPADDLGGDFDDVTVLIPARNEASVIERTLNALRAQGSGLRIVLIDDESSDGTAVVARSLLISGLLIINGAPLSAGWTGKLWALEQGLRCVETQFVLLLDADIELRPGMLAALRQKIEGLDLVSIMAQLRMETLWERMLVPAFVYFFKLIYPFRIGNDPRTRLGVAAGGCTLLRSDALREIGGFASLRMAIIDDCGLAKEIKKAGGRTWMGLSHSVRSHRPYKKLSDFWEMVARTAFAQLHFSIWLLFATTMVMILGFWVPVIGLWASPALIRGVASAGIAAMMISYLPILRYYQRSIFWILALPVTGSLYLLMTWSSAFRFWRGKKAEWKGRIYSA